VGPLEKGNFLKSEGGKKKRKKGRVGLGVGGGVKNHPRVRKKKEKKPGEVAFHERGKSSSAATGRQPKTKGALAEEGGENLHLPKERRGGPGGEIVFTSSLEIKREKKGEEKKGKKKKIKR